MKPHPRPRVDESSTQNAKGPAETAISPSHSSPSAEKVEQMDNSSTAAPAARVDWCATANRYESTLFKMKALTRNIESTMIENTGPIDGSPGSYAIPEGVYEEIVAILSGMEAISERALEAA